MSNKSQLKENNSLLRSILFIVNNKQSKTVTPSSAVQTVSADAGGILGTVTVKAVPDSEKKGLYAWQKYNYVPEQTVNFDNITITATRPDTSSVVFTSSDFDITSIRDASFFDGLTCGKAPYTLEFVLDSSGHIMVSENGTRIGTGSWDWSTGTLSFSGTSSERYGSGNLNVSGSKTIPGYISDFADFCTSDNASAYPDGGTQDGYWYEKIIDLPSCFGFTKIAIDKFTLSSSITLTKDGVDVSHSLNEKPQIAFLIANFNNFSSENDDNAIMFLNTAMHAKKNVVTNYLTYSDTYKSQYYGSNTQNTTSGWDNWYSNSIRLYSFVSSHFLKAGIEYTLITMA